MPRIVTATDLRARLGRKLDALRESDEALYVLKHGRLAGVLLERLEYVEDSLAALQVRAEPDASGPWAEVRG